MTTLKKITNKVTKFLQQEATEEEALTLVATVLSNVESAVDFVQDPEEENLITHTKILFKVGDSILSSDPNPLAWPVQLLPLPQAFEGKVN